MLKVFKSCTQLFTSSVLKPNTFTVLIRNSSSENPFSRTINIIGNDVKSVLGIEKKMVLPTSHCDILIVGGGCMGSSIAYWLKEMGLDGLSVVVVEKDPTVMLSDNIKEKVKYQQCTTVLSVGGLRQQFSLKENVELSMYSAEFFRNIKHHLSVMGHDPPNLQFQPGGYMLLATEKSAHILEENVKLQRSLNAKIELLTPVQLKNKFPWLNTEGIVLGSHGLQNEGWFDPYSLLFAFKKKAISTGAEYITGEVTDFTCDENSKDDNGNHTYAVNDAVITLPDGEKHNLHFSIVVIASGCLSSNLLRMAARGKSFIPPIPIEPRKRYVFNIHCPDGPVYTPMVIDPSGAYFRREGLGGHYLCGISPPDEEEPPVDNLDVDYSFFEEKLWPIIANRCPAFEKAKVKSAWAGFYDHNKFDENAFIGQIPGIFNIYIAAGFSGHGIQQSPAIGRAIAELIIEGDYKTIDLGRLELQRFIENEPLYETNII